MWGLDHPDTLSGIEYLALCIDRQGRHSEAEPLFCQAVEGRTRVLVPEHTSTLSDINHLAACIAA